MGESGIGAGFAVFIAAALLWWMSKRASRSRGALAKVIVAGSIVAAVASTAVVVVIGHSGATSAWAKESNAAPHAGWGEEGEGGE